MLTLQFRRFSNPSRVWWINIYTIRDKQLSTGKPHIYAWKYRVNIGSDIGLSPIRHQPIVWARAGLFWSGILQTFHLRNCSWKCRRLRNDGHFRIGEMSWNISWAHPAYARIAKNAKPHLYYTKWWKYEHTALNILWTRQNGGHFTDDIFKCIFLNENVWISLKFFSQVQNSNITALV